MTLADLWRFFRQCLPPAGRSFSSSIISQEVETHKEVPLYPVKNAGYYAAHRERINAQKRAAYAEKKLSTEKEKSATIVTDKSLKQFASEQIFQKHYNKHVKEFGKISAQEYLERANIFVDVPLSDDVVQLVRSDGSISKYCFSTNEFVVVTTDGNIRTYFKSETKRAYWDEELKRNK